MFLTTRALYITHLILDLLSNSFLQTNYSKVFNNFCSFKQFYVFKRTCFKTHGNFNFYTKLVFPLTLTFFTTIGMFLKKK